MSEKIKKILINKIKEQKTKKDWKSFWAKILIWFAFFMFSCFVAWILFLFYLLQDLPTMEELKNIQTKESTQILDRNWNVLYTIFWDENRKVIPFDKITNNTIYAIISLEDENFFNHWWVDYKWLIRAILGQLGLINFDGWGSTITQQFVKNKFLSSQRTYIRKLKEMILSMQLENTYSKEEIITMYLNQIPFWSNIYWIEQATKAFFWKDASEIDLAESVIIASIPNATTRYSPYWNYVRSKLKWVSVEELEEKWVKNYSDFIEKFWENKFTLWLLPKKIILNFEKTWTWKISWTWEITWTWKIIETWSVILPWRSSFALDKMEEMWYISKDLNKKIFNELLDFKFKKNVEKIEAPHFVMYVREKLEKEFWIDILKKWWLKVFTTLDLGLQKKAEEIVAKNAEYNVKHFWAENQSLMTINTKNWEILTMVWSRDYFNDEIDGQVNVLTQKRLIWSTFKPFAYIAMLLSWYSPYSIVFDTETNFWEKWNDYEPQNFDWKFMGPMSLWEALWNSRNIPAIKAGLVWWIEKVYNIAKSLWIKFENSYDWYWASLPLWTVWWRWIDLLSAYMVFANNWEKIEPKSILKIIDRNWIILKKERKNEWENVLDPQIAYQITEMLSNPKNRWVWWNSRMQLRWRVNIAKTWTSNKSVKKPWVKKPVVMPMDWWIIWVTPQYATVVWSWNNNWTTMKRNWSWWWTSWKTWKEFMEFLHKDLPAEKFKKPEWIQLVKYAKLSWLLPSQNTPKDLIATWVFSKYNLPKKYDNSLKFVEVDLVSKKLPTKYTPEDAIWKVAVLNMHSLKPYDKRWEDPVQDWIKENWKEFLKKYWIKDILTDIPTEYDNVHTRQNTLEWPKISISYPKDWWIVWNKWFSVIPEIKTQNWIARVDFYVNWELNTSAFKYPYIWNIKLKDWLAINSKIDLKIKVFDNLYNSSTKNISLKIWEDDKPPYTEIVRPKNWQDLVAGSTFEVKTLTYDQWWQIWEVIFYLNWKKISEVEKSTFSVKIQVPRIIWEHKIKIVAIDTAWNSSFDEKVFNSVRIRNTSKDVDLNLPKNIFANKAFDFSISMPYSKIKDLNKIEVIAKKRWLWWEEIEIKIWEINNFEWNATWFFYLTWILDKWNYLVYLKKYTKELEKNEDWENFEIWTKTALEVK